MKYQVFDHSHSLSKSPKRHRMRKGATIMISRILLLAPLCCRKFLSHALQKNRFRSLSPPKTCELKVLLHGY